MRSKLASLLSEVRSSIWLRPILRLVLALAGVLTLACIGRFVAAGGPVPPAAAASPQAPPPQDAAAPAPPVEPVDAAPPLPLAPLPAQAHGPHATEDDPVYLNDATLDDLRRLPGVGPKRAMAIVDLRTKLGGFRQIEDLLRVKGIGRATLKKLRPLVKLERRDGG